MLQSHFYFLLIGALRGRYHYGLQFSNEEAELLGQTHKITVVTLKGTHLYDYKSHDLNLFIQSTLESFTAVLRQWCLWMGRHPGFESWFRRFTRDQTYQVT